MNRCWLLGFRTLSAVAGESAIASYKNYDSGIQSRADMTVSVDEVKYKNLLALTLI